MLGGGDEVNTRVAGVASFQYGLAGMRLRSFLISAKKNTNKNEVHM
jgi:hypothetical protein